MQTAAALVVEGMGEWLGAIGVRRGSVGGTFRMGYAINYDVGKLSKFRGFSHEIYAGIGLPYHNSRENFSKRKYLNNKRNHSRDFHKGYKHRRWYN